MPNHNLPYRPHPNSARAQRINSRSPQLAKESTVPPAYVGKAYRDLTGRDHFAIRVWRYLRSLCETCGGEHGFQSCPRLASTIKDRENKGVCLHCAAPEHAAHECTTYQERFKDLRGFARQDEVPWSLVGLAYAGMSPADKALVREYRKENNRCFTCGQDHTRSDCAIYKKQVIVQLKREGEEDPKKKQFPFTILPPEVRLQIWLLASQKKESVNVYKGWLNRLPFTPGVPIGEVLEAFLRVNILDVGRVGQYNHLLDLLNRYDLYKHVHAVQFDDSDHIDQQLARAGKLTSVCPNFIKIVFVVQSHDLCLWKGSRRTPWEKIASFVNPHGMTFNAGALAELEQIKAISFKGQFAYGSKRDMLSSFPMALELLVEEVKERLIRPMYVGWSIGRDRDNGFDAISAEQK